LGNQKILLVEDYDDTRAMTRIFIEMLGYDVIEARDGQEAIEHAMNECPSLILMDLGLPRMNGIEATRKIKADICPKIPVVALTAYEDYDDEAIQAGCLDVIHKPCDFVEIGRVISKFIVL
jgi:CheY-like chemotaxis protein